MLEQPDGIAFAILDAQIEDVPGWRRSVRSDQPPISADSVPELAEKLGLNAAELERTVADYNAACPGAGAFDPLIADRTGRARSRRRHSSAIPSSVATASRSAG